MINYVTCTYRTIVHTVSWGFYRPVLCSLDLGGPTLVQYTVIVEVGEGSSQIFCDQWHGRQTRFWVIFGRGTSWEKPRPGWMRYLFVHFVLDGWSRLRWEGFRSYPQKWAFNMFNMLAPMVNDVVQLHGWLLKLFLIFQCFFGQLHQMICIFVPGFFAVVLIGTVQRFKERQVAGSISESFLLGTWSICWFSSNFEHWGGGAGRAKNHRKRDRHCGKPRRAQTKFFTRCRRL